MYIRTLDIIKQNIFFGVGPGNWKIELPKTGFYENNQKGDKILIRPHNDFYGFVLKWD